MDGRSIDRANSRLKKWGTLKAPLPHPLGPTILRARLGSTLNCALAIASGIDFGSAMAIYNGYPLWYSDTSGYLGSGWHLNANGSIRPIWYGV